MDIFTKGALWDYWKVGSDEIEPTDEESSNLEEANNDDEHEGQDGYCNGGNLPGAYIVGNSLHYQELEWYDALEDSELKEEDLRNKAIIEGMIDDDNESSNDDWKRWEMYEIANHDHESEHENEYKNKERYELFDDANHELPVCTIRRFEMIKYSFELDEEYVAVKENKYEDFTSTSEDACQTYQEIFRMMDEGWLVTRDE
nr:hypothetical protein [Tanacetum cinerariifolium]GEZ93192.1 hypothetical protein [Tanacetum cinerariifolium]